MTEHYREIADRLRALTYATSRIIRFARTLAGDASSPDTRAAARDLTDHDRAQVVAFLVHLRHDQEDAGDAERVRVLDSLIEALAREQWDNLSVSGPDAGEPLI
jgi:hypothetical protein